MPGFNQAWVVADVKRLMRFAVRHKHTALLNKLSKDAQIDGKKCHLRQGVPYKERDTPTLFSGKRGFKWYSIAETTILSKEVNDKIFIRCTKK